MPTTNAAKYGPHLQFTCSVSMAVVTSYIYLDHSNSRMYGCETKQT